jgi:cell division protein FtsB|tara:strand:- start:124 stop:408 length:285 start_codon:yes stop_codon:yes gene_type:complete
MFNFKVFLLLLIPPISYLVYHLVGFDRGINAYYEKVKELKNKEQYKNELTIEINKYKEKLKLLDKNNIDLDYLEEKSFEVLGNTSKNSYNIIIK